MGPIANTNAPHINSSEEIWRFFSEQSQILGGASDIRAFHPGTVTTVFSIAESAGVSSAEIASSNLPDSLGTKILDNLPSIDMSLSVSGAAVPEAQKQRMEQGNPQDPTLRTIQKLTGTKEE